MLPGVRKLTDAEHEAIKLLMEVAEEQCFEMRFAPGDIQLLNNHVVYHGRTAFKDDATTGQDRMLMRLWLSVPNSRALPEDHAVLWGDIGAGRPHGGIGQSAVAQPAGARQAVHALCTMSPPSAGPDRERGFPVVSGFYGL